MIAWLAFLAFILCMGYVVWDTCRPKRVKWHDDVPVIGGYEALECLRRAGKRKP